MEQSMKKNGLIERGPKEPTAPRQAKAKTNFSLFVKEKSGLLLRELIGPEAPNANQIHEMNLWGRAPAVRSLFFI